ncbi:Protein FAM185A [Stylophora pistillata]|uniref:Protein FAM185A n=1 Tax=Stylophora pistillata TaxID=50429 RepID=A0A2B4RC08_STYPI|nr:Protein FAM185A [Stylophora pistillata]
MDGASKDIPFIVVQSPYTVKIQPVNPMEVIENVDTDGQSVKGNVYLETDDEGDLAPDLKNSFLKDIEFNVRPVSSNSKDYLEVKTFGESFTEIHVEEGNISIGSTSGQLEAFTGRGSIDVNLSQHEDVKLNTKEGDITIKCLQESFSSEFLVKSNHIHVDSNINVVIDEERAEGNQTVMAGKLNKQDKGEEQIKMINAEAKLGTVKFEKEDWFTSLKLS